MKILRAKATLRFLKKYITKNLLTKHTENLSPYRYDVYTHMRFLKTAVKTHTPSFAGSSADGLAGTTTRGRGGTRDGDPGTRDGDPGALSVLSPGLWFAVSTSPEHTPATLCTQSSHPLVQINIL